VSRFDALAERLRGLTPRVVEDPARRQAAVSLVLAPGPDRLLLIRRAEHPADPWSGQMGLPGGRRVPEDPDLLATAIRETGEELGLSLHRQFLAGTLDDLAPVTPVLPPVIVRPHVFLLDRPPGDLILSREVQYARWAPLEELGRPGIYRSFTYEHRGTRIVRPAYHLGGDVIWGMTERILTPFLRLLGIELPADDRQD
jgi:8-oxo-dGTP pyrophosphatase MutT (NUDIX family)